MMLTRRNITPLRKLMMIGETVGAAVKLVEDTATGNPLTFITDVSKPLKSLFVPFTPMQAGSGDPSPENIRSILPWNGLTVFGGWKNLLNVANGGQGSGIWKMSFSEGKVINSEMGSGASDYVIFSLDIKAGTYTLSVECSDNIQPRLLCTASYQGGTYNSYYKAYYTNGKKVTFTITETAKVGVVFNAPNHVGETGNISDIQLEAGSTDTAYEPYHPITETDISFPSPVYGGTPDIISGRMLVTHVCIEVKKRDFMQAGHGQMSYRQTPNNYIIQHKPKSGVNWELARQTQKMECAVIANPYSETTFGNYIGVCLWDVTIPTTFRISMDVYDSMQNDDDSISICYEIAEPFEIQLTPAQITAIKGKNTVWSDANELLLATFLKKK